MRRKRILSMAWQNMKLRRLRTSLTTLGVIIGITAIIALASLGEGFRTTIKERMEQGFELDVLTVIPGSFFAGLGNRFTFEDVQNVTNVANVSIATPVMQRSIVVLNKNGENATALIVIGVNFIEFWEVFSRRLNFEEPGELPVQIKNDTMVLGYKLNHPTENATFAFPGDNIIMQFTTRDNPTPQSRTFKVAGTLEKSGAGALDFDYSVFLPLDTMRQMYGAKQADYLDLIFVKLVSPEFSENVATAIEEVLMPRFGYQLTILEPVAFIQQVDFILNMVEIFLTSIASIALLVAGIGIMNIATVSVMERTREIGILKAIGAKSITVLTIFLAETALVGLMGGLIGVPTGYGISFLLSHLLSSFMGPQHGGAFQRPEVERVVVRPVFSLSWAIGALVFGIVVCVLFGLYPSRKAAKLDPVEALRYE